MDMVISFPGGLRVEADGIGPTVRTDQPVFAGGDGSAPTPFALFLGSIGTCAGIYVLQFCRQRGIPTEGVRIVQHMDFDPQTRLLRHVELEIQVPPDFPERYHKAIIHASNVCAVKQMLADPPTVATTLSVTAGGDQARA